MKNAVPVAISILLIFSFSSCNKTRNNRANNFVPDMLYSRAYETYSENPNFEDNKTARRPVEGTIPRDFVPYQYPNTPEGKIIAGKELVNPVDLNKKNLKRGEKMYKRFCISCHGEKGDGLGYLFTSGKYPVLPRTMLDENFISKADGEIYHVITVGSAVMGAHGNQIEPPDRWKIIHYIKEVLQKKRNM